jgi:hypothetical protein
MNCVNESQIYPLLPKEQCIYPVKVSLTLGPHLWPTFTRPWLTGPRSIPFARYKAASSIMTTGDLKLTKEPSSLEPLSIVLEILEIESRQSTVPAHFK